MDRPPTDYQRPTVGATLTALLCLLTAGCVGVPDGVEPIAGFELERYLGRWYEIARLDHRFERDLINVSAEYTLREDGSVGVLNRGYSTRKAQWDAIEGRALFVGERDVAEIKVSFFGPFFGGYNVIALDREHYAYALVCGPNRDFLWILSREPTLADAIKNDLVEQARALGFAVDDLIWVRQEEEAPRDAKGAASTAEQPLPPPRNQPPAAAENTSRSSSVVRAAGSARMAASSSAR